MTDGSDAGAGGPVARWKKELPAERARSKIDAMPDAAAESFGVTAVTVPATAFADRTLERQENRAKCGLRPV